MLENHKGGAKTASYEPQRSLPSRQPRPRPTTASTNSNERPERKMQIICFYLYITSMLLSPFQKSDSTSRILCSQAGLYGIPHYITFLCCFLDTNVIYGKTSGEEKDKRSAPNIEFFKHPELETLSVPSNEKCWKQLLLVRSPLHLCSNCFFSKVTS